MARRFFLLDSVGFLKGDVRERLGHMRARVPLRVGALVLSRAWALRLSLRGIPSGHGFGEELSKDESISWGLCIASGSFV